MWRCRHVCERKFVVTLDPNIISQDYPLPLNTTNMKSPPCFEDPETKKAIAQLCKDQKIDIPLLKALCDVTNSFSGSGRADGINRDISDCIERFLERSQAQPQ